MQKIRLVEILKSVNYVPDPKGKFSAARVDIGFWEQIVRMLERFRRFERN
jgi:hypothetical protein